MHRTLIDSSHQDSLEHPHGGLLVTAARTPAEVEAARELRVHVFVEEQGVPLSQEFDEHDESAVHAIALLNGCVVGTGRVYLDGDGQARIGRMAVDAPHRRRGIGGRVLAFLEGEARRMGAGYVALHAQTRVRSFYERSGYRAQGKPFVEVDIEHILMVKALD